MFIKNRNPKINQTIILEIIQSNLRSYHIGVFDGKSFKNNYKVFNTLQVNGWRYPTTAKDRLFVRSVIKSNLMIDNLILTNKQNYSILSGKAKNKKVFLEPLKIWDLLKT